MTPAIADASAALRGAEPPSAIVSVRGLKRRFGDFWAVGGLDLHLDAGEVVGLLGPNGAGKSTTIRMICGLLRPTEGTLRVAGFDPVRQPLAVKQRIGYLTQQFSLYPDLTSRENLEFYGAMYGLGGGALREATERWLRLLDLGDYAARPMGDLPPGWTRRVGFACAAVAESPVLLLDEPTSGVDLETSDLMWRLCGQEAARGAAVLVSTHSMAEAERCSRVCIMASGKIVGRGTPQSLEETLRGRMLGLQAQPLGGAVAALKAWPPAKAVAVVGRWIRVEVEGDAETLAAEASRVVQGAGGHLVEAQVLAPTLDDVFVHLVTAEEADR